MNKLSVVIITKNEERNIAKCIESVIRATSDFPKKEVLLVDSASTDKTIEIARKYTLKIIQLNPSFFMSPSAGRYIGFLYTGGEYVFFVDGDMTVDESWLSKNIPFLENDTKVAGIAGKGKEFYFGENYNLIGEKEDRYEVGDKVKEVNNLGGAALYRRSVLNQVGGFNQYLYSEEELELGLRIYKAGYKLLRIPYIMTTHYTTYYTNNTLSKLTARQIKRMLNSNLFVGAGQVLRLSVHNKFLLEYIKHFKRLMLFISLLLLGLMSLGLSLSLHKMIIFEIWIIAMLILFFIRSIIKKSVKDTIIFTVYYTCSFYGLIKGFLMRLKDPHTYHIDAIINNNLRKNITSKDG